jgi:hypothetical protein
MSDHFRQICGPPAGAITDAFGSLSHAPNISASMRIAGARMIHAIVTHDGKPRTQPLQHGGCA